MTSVRIASRVSKLALAQTNIVKKELLALTPELEVTLVAVSTKGDRDKSDFLYKSQSVGVFTSEVENTLLDGRADLAVHSLKDLPTAITPGLKVAAIPSRESPADALVTAMPTDAVSDLPAGATVGTSSLRRIAQLRRLRQDLKCIPLRGNVETRIAKVTSGQIDAAVVACAGLNRLSLEHNVSVRMDPREFIPAPAQGALALQVRDDNEAMEKLVAQLDHKQTRIAVEAERHILATMKGGCSIPLGVYAEIIGQVITIRAVLSDLDGNNCVSRTGTAPVDEAQKTATELAQYLLNNGGSEILDRIRSANHDPTT